MGKAVAAALITVAGVVLIATLSSRLDFYWAQTSVNKTAIEHYDGNAYLYWLEPTVAPFLFMPIPIKEKQSALRIERNGVPLSEASSPAKEVIEIGGGRYNHADGFVLFSAPDNSNPKQGEDIYVVHYPYHASWILIATFIFVFVCLILLRPGIIKLFEGSLPFREVGRRALLLSFVCGVLLILVNSAGLFMTLSNDALYKNKDLYFGENDVTLTGEQAISNLGRKTGESDLDYGIRVNGIINRSIGSYAGHIWASKFNFPIPIWENFILWGFAQLSPRYYRYEYIDPIKALKRGVGACGQHAMIIVGILRDAGINARMVMLDGHVVATAELTKGTWQILDPMYGVHMPFSMAQIGEAPELIVPYYRKSLQSVPWPATRKEHEITTLVHEYGPTGNTIDQSETGLSGYLSGQIHIERENTAYIYKWLFPLALIAFWVLPFLCSPAFPFRRRRLNSPDMQTRMTNTQ